MNLRRVVLCIGVLTCTASSWSSTTASGSYVSRGPGFAKLLQITQTNDGRLIGTLSHAALKADGTIEKSQDGLTGAVDGHSITLVINAPLSLGASMSGTLDGNVITLISTSGSERFSLAQPSEYQSAVRQLTSEGHDVQQRLSVAKAQSQRAKLLRDQNAEIADLNRRLQEYAARVTATTADDQQKAVHAAHDKALARARQLWEKEQTLPRGSYEGGQVAYAIRQVSFQLESFNYPLEDAPKVGRDHIKQYDEEIAKSLCQHRSDPALTNCFEQDAAVQAYHAARPVVLKRMDDLDATLSADKATMKGIVDAADAYSSSR
jgi:division protein CdvB (Snf7/Vps24/ESCRT-III family)